MAGAATPPTSPSNLAYNDTAPEAWFDDSRLKHDWTDDLPRGIVSKVAITAATGGITGSYVNMNGGALTFTLVSGRQYRVTFSGRWFATVADTAIAAAIGDGTTDWQVYRGLWRASYEYVYGEVLYTGSGSKTFTAKIQRTAGTGTVQYDVTSAAVGYLILEDVGAT